MTEALNYSTKAIEELSKLTATLPPMDAAGVRYLVDKLRQAQVFMLSDSGQLLDRSKPRPEVPGILYRPPFPVVALEYQARRNDWDEGVFSAVTSSKRIALAWTWTDDAPAALTALGAPDRDGVVIASISYFDEMRMWVPMAAAMHLPFDQPWTEGHDAHRMRATMVASGRIAPAMANQKAMNAKVLPIMPEGIRRLVQHSGPHNAIDMLASDLMDEVNAYLDLMMALACTNVSTRRHDAPGALNRARIKAGKLPLKDFHTLELGDGAAFGGVGVSSERGSPRSHLRRGHIRRLPGERVTWVNAAIVQGRGFVAKQYSVKGRAAHG